MFSILLLYLTNIIGHRYSFVFLLFGMAVSFAVMIFCSARIRQFWISSHPATRLVANASYAIYLTHTLVIHFVTMAMKKVMPNVELPFYVWLVLLFATTMAGGIAFYLIIEKPLMKLREKYFPSRGKQIRQSAAPDKESSHYDVERI